MNPTNQLSVIICSIDADKCRDCTLSLKRTAGIGLDFHVIDNRDNPRPIAEVYNQAAAEASSPYLLFVHEDVIISSDGWGKELIGKLAAHDTGVIGFAGSTLRVPVPGGWDQGGPQYMRASLRHMEHGRECDVVHGRIDGETFRQVISVDGLAMAVRREVWAAHPFDVQSLDGFHCYDIDFSVAIAAAGYKNYVMYGVDVMHLSAGSYSDMWLRATIDIFRDKWTHIPVMSVDEVTPEAVADAECRCLYGFIFKAIRSDVTDDEVRRLMKLYRSLPHSSRHYFRHLFTLTIRHLRHRH